MQDKKDKKKGKKGKEPQVAKTKQIRRRRNGPKNHELAAFCRAVNNSARPDITRGLLSERVYVIENHPNLPDEKFKRVVRHFRLYRAA